MLTLRQAGAALAVASLCVQQCLAQADPVMETDAKTNITFGTWGYTPNATDPNDPGYGAFTFGMALPPTALTVDANDYVGLLRCSISSSTDQGWCGMSHGVSGQMTNALLVMAWVNGNDVMTSLRYTQAYKLPPVYTGNATITQISSFVNATTYEVIYRCQNCFVLQNSDGSSTRVSTSQKSLVLGRAQAIKSPTTPGCPAKISFGFHDNGYAQFGAPLDKVVQPSYSAWAALATKVVATNCGADTPTASASVTSAAATTTVAVPTTSSARSTASVASNSTFVTVPISSTSATAITINAPTTATSVAPSSTSVVTSSSSSSAAPTSTAPSCTAVATDSTAKSYDYIIVGAGAAGIPLADRISAAGHTVLLIEKGPPSSGRYGGTMKPDWLTGTNLTRFDVPGLCNEIWVDSEGIACTDMDQMAGCVLGGGTAVNAGLWWKPNPKDWDYNFPTGWKSTDLVTATNSAFARIPGTTTPSMDGKLYQQEGFNVLASGFNKTGWTYLVPNDNPTLKNRTYGHTTYMFSHGERGGPMATYLQTAVSRTRYMTLWMNTGVRRLVRVGGHVTGVELECNGDGGQSGVVNVTAHTGKVILSAGVFGTSKILFRSGIGPSDQLNTVKTQSDDGPTMIDDSQWIDTPVGYNLVDHVNTDTIITHPDVVFYDFYAAWKNPIASDKTAYLSNRTRILAQAAPNIGPMFWEEIRGSDGIIRQLQWTARVEGNSAITTSTHAMTMSQYLGRGSVSRGRLGITSDLDTTVLIAPYLHDDFDKEVVIQGIKNLQKSLSGIPNLEWVAPHPNQTVEDYVNTMDTSPSTRRSNHWMGTAKMGEDDGRQDGSAVVDLNTKVYGTDNLFVVDASIFPGQPTGNPSAMIVVAAENAATRIMNVAIPSAGYLGAQCGGNKWTGSFQCVAPYQCRPLDPTYSICALAAGTTRFTNSTKAN